jgi:hypothetical protein
MNVKYDPRRLEETEVLLKRLPPCKYKPLVGPADLREIEKIFGGLPNLRFPINSAGELIEKLGSGKSLEIVGMTVNPLRMIKYMPFYYFPIASLENFIEKLAQLIRENRKQSDIPRELVRIKRQLGKLRFPISNSEQLLRSVKDRKQVMFQGRPIRLEDLIDRIPSGFFPIRSSEEFDSKVGRAIATRPLIVKE